MGAAFGLALSGGANAAGIAVGISLAENTIDTNVAAFIDSDGSAATSVPPFIVDTTSDLSISATESASIDALAVAASISGGGATNSGYAISGGGAWSSNTIWNTTNAYIANTPALRTAGDMTLIADGNAQIAATVVAVTASAAFGPRNAGALSIGAALADENAQPDIYSFGTFRLFKRPAAYLYTERCTLNGHRIRRIRAGPSGGGQEIVGQIGKGLRHGKLRKKTCLR